MWCFLHGYFKTPFKLWLGLGKDAACRCAECRPAWMGSTAGREVCMMAESWGAILLHRALCSKKNIHLAVPEQHPPLSQDPDVHEGRISGKWGAVAVYVWKRWSLSSVLPWSLQNQVEKRIEALLHACGTRGCQERPRVYLSLCFVDLST